ncbi:small subunit ribosomal protein S1 [Spirochaeta isovalerica]|uniref:Cytidylate kinase n=1 Tax=Spirochaeta isovalerica TaxID=150 RepID=A0A841R4K5_9SPIO|nr:small subunit ribosomal protein S1 [Spirochaeta isovalerica]
MAIDGPAGVGKSTISSKIARDNGFFNLNSGNFYRAITKYALNNDIDYNNEDELIAGAEACNFKIEEGRLYLNEVDVEDDLHTDQIDSLVAQISAVVPVRHIVNENLRRIARSMDLVAEGRDMTTVVFPHAEIKIFLDASPEIRAKRRKDQGVSDRSFEEIVESIKERDRIDRNKKEGSLIIAGDALYLDTSDLTIEEVCEKVTEKINDNRLKSQENGTSMAEMDAKTLDSNQQELQEEYLKGLESLEEGQLVDGEVIQVDSDYVYIDIGYKSEGKIPVEDFDNVPATGETISVVLVKKEGKNGDIVVSKKKADSKVIWKKLKDAFQDKTPVEGKIVKSIKGGFEVDFGTEFRAFIPISKVDISRVENPEEYIGLKSMFLIERLYNEKRVNIVVSRREWLEKEIEGKRNEFFENVKIGDEVTGIVKSFTSFGAFIDLGGFDGLLHINDMSWGHVTRPKDFVKKDQEIKLKVIRLEPEDNKINLSLKHFTEDPWSTFESRYNVEDVVKGKVTKLTDFGAFVEIEEGIEGLVHISELSWVKRIKHPQEVLSIGDEVEVMILGYDIQQGRISLGIKQVMPNPWDSIIDEYPVGKVLKRTVKKITNAGAFIELEEGIDGFLHADDMSWTRKIKNISSVLKEGEEVEVSVIGVDPESRRISLGVKQLSQDPWETLENSYPRGSVIEGEITNKTDFGLFVKVPGDIEGLIHKNNLTVNRDDDPEEILAKFNVGDKITAAVTEINPSRQRLSLSVKELKLREQKAEISKYMHEEEEDSTFTLGDMINND